MTATVKKTTKQAADANSVVTVELVNIEGMLPSTVFTAENINQFIARIEKEKKAFTQPDATTPAGRAAIIKFANRFTKTKTAVDDMGKDYVAILKDEPKRIDALRKLFRDTMDAWHAEVRKPVTLLEEADKKRKEAHEKHLADIGAQITFPAGQPSSAEVQRRIDFVMLFQQRAWEEFDELYQTTYKAVMESLKTTLEASKNAEANAAELAKLKAKQAQDAEDTRVEKARLDGIAEGQRLAALAAAPPVTDIKTTLILEGDEFGGGTVKASDLPAATTDGQTVTISVKVKDEAKDAVNREVLADLLAYGCTEAGAKALIKAILTGTIRHVTINY